jgi:CheY-like chemotaxis protein/DNA-binding transcriptional ArsR family regulator
MPDSLPVIAESAAEIAELLRHVPEAKRRKPLEALQLLEAGSLRSKQAIAERFGVTRRTVNRWLKRYAESGAHAFVSEKDPPNGEPRALLTPDSLRGVPCLDVNDPERASEFYAAFLKTLDSFLSGAEHRGNERTDNGASSSHGRAPTPGLRSMAEETAAPFVMLGEADDLVATIVEARLEREGMRVERAVDGIQLVALTEERSPDLILLDIRLSGLDGYQITRWIRQHERLHSTPVILLGWPGKETDVVDAFNAGADDYILKPFSPIDLSARVGRLLARNPGISPKSSSHTPAAASSP